MVLTCGDILYLTLANACPRRIPGQALIMMCPRSDTHLTYMINIALTKEFSLAADGGR
jgi:hypothetical protein